MDPVLERERVQDRVLGARREVGKTTIMLTSDIFQCSSDGIELVCILHEGHIAADDIGSFDELYKEGSRLYEIFEEAKNNQRIRLADMTLAEAQEPEDGA